MPSSPSAPGRAAGEPFGARALEGRARSAYDAARNLEGKPFRSVCYAPFVSLFFTTQGKVLACCKNGSYALGHVQEQRLRDIWHGERTARLRDALKEYRFNLDCGFCEWDIGSGNYQSAAPLLFDELPVVSAAPDWPVQIEFEGSNTCNFECIMCNGDTSSSIRARRDGLPPLPRPYQDQFFEDLRPFLPHLKRARFFGGEPFLTPESLRIWEMMIEDGLATECHVTTNGSQYNERVCRILDNLPFHLVVSIDGATKNTVERIRVNSVYEDLVANIGRLHAYTRQRGTTFHLAFCLMRQNWHEFADLLLFAENMGVEVWVNTVVDPSFCSLYTLPAGEIQRIVARLEQDGKRLEGLQVNRYTWDQALTKLRAAAAETHRHAVVEVLSRHYVPDDAVERASELVREGRPAEALAVASAVPESDAGYYYALNVCAYSQLLLGDLAGADVSIARALFVSTRRPEAHLNLARLRARTDRLNDARTSAQCAADLALDEDRIKYEALELLAFVCVRQGRVRGAVRALSQLAVLQAGASPIAGLVYPAKGLRPELSREAGEQTAASRISTRIVSALLASRVFTMSRGRQPGV